MKKYYYLLEPIQGVQVRGGASQMIRLPAGTVLGWVRRPQRWPNVAEVEYDGVIVILFFDDLCRRSEIREFQALSTTAGG